MFNILKSSKILSTIAVSVALCLPLTAFAKEDSSRVKPKKVHPMNNTSYVNTGNCVYPTKVIHNRGDNRLKNQTFNCPTDRPVVVRMHYNRLIDQDYGWPVGDSVTGIRDAVTLTCCPVDQRWKEVKSSSGKA